MEKNSTKTINVLEKKIVEYMANKEFELTCLSITHDTYIATGFNSFVVKKIN